MSKHIYNLRRDRPDKRDYHFTAKKARVPDEYDPRPDIPPVYDQGNLGSCTANAGASDFDRVLHTAGHDYIIPSRLYIYYNERVIDKSVKEDAGSTGRTLMQALTKQGACPETMWPYDVSKFATKPDAECYTTGTRYQALKYGRVGLTEAEITATLSQGVGICVGIAVYESFEGADVAKTGIIPMPGKREQLLGGHEVYLFGYRYIDTVRYGILLNSWGAGWGDEGCFYLPMSYLTDANLTYDMWALQEVEDGI